MADQERMAYRKRQRQEEDARKALEKRGMPHHDEAEKVLLGAMMLDSANIPHVLEFVNALDFYHEAHQHVFSGLVEMFEEDREIDPVLLAETLIKKDQLDHVGGFTYLDNLTSGVPRTANLPYYAGIVREKSMLRQLALLGQKISRVALDPDSDPIQAMGAAENELMALREGKVSHGFQEMATLLSETYELVQERAGQEGFVGLRSGFLDYDRMTNGLQKGDLIIVAARPAMGKTSFCLNVALNAAILDGAKVAIFSLEMPANQLVMRLLGSEARVSISGLRSGRLEPEEWNSLGQSVGKLSEARIFIDDSGESTVATMRGQLKRLKMEAGVDLVVIDYLQLMSGSSLAAQQSRVQEVSAISRGLKLMAKEIDCPVIALSQLSRAAEQRSDHRPQLSDLRESGSIEQDADQVAFLYREDYYKEREKSERKDEDDADAEDITQDFGVAELIIAKHRNGPTGVVNLAFFKKYTRFENYSEEMEFMS